MFSVADMHIQTRMVCNSIGEYTLAEIITSLESLSNKTAELAQWIRALDDLTEDMGSILSPTESPTVTPSPGDLIPS